MDEFRRRMPRYPDDSDYKTNASSYYEELARKNKLIEVLALKIEVHLDEAEKVLDAVIEKIGTGFNQEIYDLFIQWEKDGTLDHIINETLMNQKADKKDLEALTTLLTNTINNQEKMIIDPDVFEGSDTQRVQQAIDQAILESKAIRFSRFFDITGYTLSFDKPASNRELLYLMGMGGGLIKKDEGYMFTARSSYAGDIVSTNMKYKSVGGRKTCVWNGNNIIRVLSTADSYVDVDSVIEAKTTYVQSCKFVNCTITGGEGWAFEWKKSFDTLIDGNTIEHREHAIRNTFFSGNPDNDSLRIVNNVIEGLTGKTIELGSSFGVSIEGNYFEQNVLDYIDLSKSPDFHNGLTIINNTFQPFSVQVENNEPAIKVGKMGNGGVLSSGNISLGVLYELLNVGTHGRLASIGDFSYSDQLFTGDEFLGYQLSTLFKAPYARNEQLPTLYYSESISEKNFFEGNEEKEIILTFDEKAEITTHSHISVTLTNPSGSFEIHVLNHRIISSNQLGILIRNARTEQYVGVSATVLNMGEDR